MRSLNRQPPTICGDRFLNNKINGPNNDQLNLELITLTTNSFWYTITHNHFDNRVITSWIQDIDILYTKINQVFFRKINTANYQASLFNSLGWIPMSLILLELTARWQFRLCVIILPAFYEDLELSSASEWEEVVPLGIWHSQEVHMIWWLKDLSGQVKVAFRSMYITYIHTYIQKLRRRKLIRSLIRIGISSSSSSSSSWWIHMFLNSKDFE